jgi:hypothetical protein
LQANRELAAKARVSERLFGTDVRAQDAEYADAGRSSSIDDESGAMLSARKVEREAKTGTPPGKLRMCRGSKPWQSLCTGTCAEGRLT